MTRANESCPVKFPKRCLEFNVIKDVTKINGDARVVPFIDLDDSRYNLRIGNRRKPVYNLTKIGLLMELVRYKGTDKAYISLVGGKNGA
ncbi:MAG: hypothetical protein Q8P15_02970 [Nanoarchaeota archaeon]|nr:hypothetical protein [Nanoarchaeota archaeon]